MNEVNEPEALYGGNYTAKDYLSWTFDELVELIKGKVWKMSPAPTSRHQRISVELSRIFANSFRKHQCTLFHAPFDVYLTHDLDQYKAANTVVQPDLCVICDRTKIKEFGCVGAPDLVVEILSKSTAKKDLNDKYNVYQEFGVKEYWVVFPLEKAITIYALVDGRFEEHGLYNFEDEIGSKLFPELTFGLEEVFTEL